MTIAPDILIPSTLEFKNMTIVQDYTGLYDVRLSHVSVP
jgi:hypothetical protein